MLTQICKTCRFEGYRCAPSSDGTCGAYKARVITNFDRIKAMSAEGLASFMADQITEHEINKNVREGTVLTATYIELFRETVFKMWLRYLESEVEV